ncbi:putative cis-3-chloroacrylic acid dehalogenase [Trichoderma velutinum]
MPLYEFCHSLELSRTQKEALVDFVTHLHSRTFLTPTLFVNVQFTRPEAEGDFYVGGKSCGAHSPNRVIAMVRVGPTRPKEKFDQIGMAIQKKWNELVGFPDDPSTLVSAEMRAERRAKKLHVVVFYPMNAAIENGVIIPGPGDEGSWLKDNMAYFKDQAEAYYDDEFRDMLQEVENREDLKKMIQ